MRLGLGIGITQPGGGGTPAPTATTWNPADKHASIALSNADKTMTGNGTGGNYNVRSTTSKSAGDLYFEIVYTTAGTSNLGLANATASLTAYLGNDANAAAFWPSEPAFSYNGGFGGYGPGIVPTGGVVGVHVRLTGSRQVWFSINGVLIAGDPSAGTGGKGITLLGAVFIAAGHQSSTAALTIRTAAADFTYTPDTGFVAWDDG
ncbi:MAG: hypothetical protein V4696_01785 [Pseudomonadota bacterium]